MKFFSAFLLLSSTVSATSFGAGFGVNVNGNQKAIVNQDLSVPGDNPLNFCEDPSEKNHLLRIEKVDLSPNPPEPGQTLHIAATGNFTTKIEEGAYVMLTVRLGSIRLIHRREDLCEQMKQVDRECPLQEGETTITRDVDLPQQIPKATFNVEADAFTKDDEKITCLRATVNFARRNEL